MFTFSRLDLSSGPPTAIQRGLSPHPRWRDPVDATLELTHERVDDVPLLLGFLLKLKLPEILDRHFLAHPLHQARLLQWNHNLLLKHRLRHFQRSTQVIAWR